MKTQKSFASTSRPNTMTSRLRTVCATKLLPLLLLLLLSVLAAKADQYGDFTYSTDGTNVTITGYTGSGSDVTIPSTIIGLPVTAIGDYAFFFPFGLTSLTSVTIPNSVTSIGDGAFYGNNLVSVTIPDSVTSVGDQAFGGCESLTDVAIGNSVTHIGSVGNQAFLGCGSLVVITVDPSNPAFSSVDAVLFNKSQTTLIECPSGKTGSYAVPNSVTNIEGSAFLDCESLTGVTISTNVASIGPATFEFCMAMTSVTIPNSVTSIGDSAFHSCASLTSVVIPDSVTNIDVWAFGYCGKLTNAVIGKGVSSIGDSAFSSCISLAGIFFQGSAPVLDFDVFTHDNNTTVYYLPGTTGWGPWFANCPTALWNPQFQVSDASFGVRTNCFGFNIVGTTNIPVVLEACTNLASPTWVTLQSCNLTNGSLYFGDPDWTNYPARLYRIRWP